MLQYFRLLTKCTFIKVEILANAMKSLLHKEEFIDGENCSRFIVLFYWPLYFLLATMNVLKKLHLWYYKIFLSSNIIIYRIAQNVGGGKHWRIWRLSIDSPKFSHPNIVNTLKCNGKPTQFAKVSPSNYTSRVISPKFLPAKILHYTEPYMKYSLRYTYV